MKFSRQQARLALKKRLKKVYPRKYLSSSRSSKKQFAKKKFFYLGGILILLSGTFYFLFFSPFFEFRKIEISQLKEIPENRVEKETNEFLKKKFFFFLPKNNFFLLKKEKLENELLKRIPQIEKIEIKKEFPPGLILRIEEKFPWAILVSEKEKKGFFLLEKRGTIIKQISEENLEKYKDLPLIESDFTKPVPENVLRFIRKVYQEFSKEIQETELVSVSFSDPSFYKISFKTSKGFKIYFELLDKRSVRQRIDLLKRFFEEKKDLLENLNYIDISIEDRVYYKEK